MKAQAGTRYIGAMNNGRVTRTTHYKDRTEFLEHLEYENHFAKKYNNPPYTDVSPIK